MNTDEFYQLYRKKTIDDGFSPIGKHRFNGIIKTISSIPETLNHLTEKQLKGVGDIIPVLQNISDTLDNVVENTNIEDTTTWNKIAEVVELIGDIYEDNRMLIRK